MSTMNLYKARMENEEGTEAFYPHTSIDIVFDSDGKSVATLLNEFKNEIRNDVTDIENQVDDKISKHSTHQFFLEPSKWSVDGKYLLDTTGFGWTSNSYLIPKAPKPDSNIELASGITVGTQTDTTVELIADSVPSEPIILVLKYGGELVQGEDYFRKDAVGKETITWTETVEHKDENILFYLNAEGDNPFVDKSTYKQKVTNNYNRYLQVADTSFKGGYCFGYDAVTTKGAYISVDLNSLSKIQIEFMFKIIQRTDESSYVYGLCAIGGNNLYAELNYTNKKKLKLKLDKYGDYIFETPLVIGAWSDIYHVVIQVDGGNFNVYLNKQLIHSGALEYYPTYNTIKFGEVDNVKNSSLRIDEICIKNTFDNGLTYEPTEKNPYWTEEVTYTKEIEITKPSWFKRENGELYKYGDVTSSSPQEPFETDENTLLLLHADDFTDSSNTPKTLTNNGTTLDTNKKRLGNSSFYFNGSANIDINNANINFGASDFTVEWWAYNTATTSSVINIGGITVGYGLVLSNLDGSLWASSNGSAWDMFSGVKAFDVTPNEWVHWALVRKGNTWTTYKNGQQFWQGTTSANPVNAPNVWIGRQGNEKYTGYIDELRISNVARYTENFDPNIKGKDKGWVKQ